MTATALLTYGYRDAGKLAQGASLTAAQQAEGLDRLNDIINLWQTQGMKLFLEVELSVTLVADQGQYSIMPGGDVNTSRALRIKEATFWDVNNNPTALDVISREEWSRSPLRSSSGPITGFFAEKLYDRMNVHFLQAPDATAATGTVKLTIHQQANNPAAIGSNVLFPSEWAIALRWAIADEVSVGMPDSVQQRCASRAQAYRQALEDWDVEDAEVRFTPDPQWTQQNISRFR